MGWFKGKAPGSKKERPKKPEATFSRQKDDEWRLRDGSNDPSAIAVQVLQDVRDELKTLNKRMATMEENFRIVFGVEDVEAKDGDG